MEMRLISECASAAFSVVMGPDPWSSSPRVIDKRTLHASTSARLQQRPAGIQTSAQRCQFAHAGRNDLGPCPCPRLWAYSRSLSRLSAGESSRWSLPSSIDHQFKEATPCSWRETAVVVVVFLFVFGSSCHDHMVRGDAGKRTACQQAVQG